MKRLKIAIAARGLYSHYGGPFEYIQGFCGELVRQAAGRHEVILYYSSPDLLGTFPRAVEHVLPSASSVLWDHVLLPRQLQLDGIDLVLFPKGTIPIWTPCRAAAIILDLGYFYPALDAYKALNTFYTRINMRYAARKAWALFTISKFTTQDVIRILGVPAEKVETIYGAASPRFRPVTDQVRLRAVREKYGLAEPFFFYPTSISPRKNFPCLLDAFEMVMDKLPHHLYFTGNLAWNSGEVVRRLEGPISARVHRLGDVLAEDMPVLYSLAQFTVYPSLFEGLGLPLLEAFQCGSPIMVSNQASLPEIAGDAALLVDPYSSESIAHGLRAMAGDDSLRKNLRSAGLKRAEDFTWQRTVGAVLDWVDSHWGS